MSDWATTGKNPGNERHIITSLYLDSKKMEEHNIHLQKKYKKMEEDIMFERTMCDDAEYLMVAFGSTARICQKALEILRSKGIKVGLLRPITLFPFPKNEINKLSGQVKGILTVEMNAGQMLEDVLLASMGKTKVEFYGRFGGMVPAPDEIVNALQEKLIGG
ncbi:MAG: transketolase C-terminal domain-containing protein [bacterium]